MTELEPVAWRIKDFADGWFFLEGKKSGENYAEMFGAAVEPLVTLSSAQSAIAERDARIAELIRNYEDAYNRGLVDGNRLSVEQQQAIHAAEARAEAAEALLKEAGESDNSLLSKLKVMRGVYAMQNEQYTSRALHNIITEFEASRAARSLMPKIGERNGE